MEKLLVLVLALLAGSASAGSLYRGYCYPTVLDASYAWCNDLALAVAGNASVSTALLGGSGVGQSSTLMARGAAYGACTAFGAVSGNTQSVTRTLHAYGSATGSTSTTGAFSPLTVPGVNQSTVTTGVATTLRFGTCTDSSNMTAADGLSLGWQVGGVWLAVAGILFLTRVLRGVA